METTTNQNQVQLILNGFLGFFFFDPDVSGEDYVFEKITKALINTRRCYFHRGNVDHLIVSSEIIKQARQLNGIVIQSVGCKETTTLADENCPMPKPSIYTIAMWSDALDKINKVHEYFEAEKLIGYIGQATYKEEYPLSQFDYATKDLELPRKITESDNIRFNNLFTEFVDTVHEACIWGRQNNFPVVEKYPHYNQIRQLGMEMYEVSGFKGMQKACDTLKQPNYDREGIGKGALVEYMWDGIGRWRR